MKYIKKFESYSAPQIDDVIESSYQKHTAEGISDKNELFNLILADAEEELAYGISLFVRAGMGDGIKERIKSTISDYLNKK